jgi:CubicO group peptidase (beta-lactamase class C family)
MPGGYHRNLRTPQTVFGWAQSMKDLCMKNLPLILVAIASCACAAPDEEILGKAQGYPVCKIQQIASDQKCLVGTLSHMEEVIPARKVAHGAPHELKRLDDPRIEADAYMAMNRNTGLMVIKDGVVLAERYNYDRKPTDRLQSYSMAKTVVAMLMGIAISERKIASVDELAATYVPALKGHPYGETTLKDLLTMSSGVEFREDYDGKDDVATLAIKTLLQKGSGGAASVESFTRRIRPAGTKWHYASAETEVLSLVVSAATGRNLSDYLSEKIWIPMGAEADAMWLIDGGGHELGYMGLSATLRDWGRLGILLANYGALNGKQIIPADWVKEATRVHAPHLEVGVASRFNGYGYQTWLIRKDQPFFALFGVRGQGIFIDPVSKLVVVHTAVFASPRDSRAAQFELFFTTLKSLGAK